MNMPAFVVVAVAAAVLALHALPAVAQSRAKADIVDMEDKDRALVAKESIRQKRDQRQQQRSGDKGSNSDCGTVDIGNDSNQKGSGRIAERQKTVIVTGNIINTANCK